MVGPKLGLKHSLIRYSMTPIRVINVSLEERIAGPTVRILQVAKRLRMRGIETVVVLPEGEGDFRQEMQRAGIAHHVLPIRRLRRSKNPLHHMAWLASLTSDVGKIASVARKERADIIHCNGLVQIAGGLAAKRAGCRIMWHLNDLAVPRYLQCVFRPVVESLSDLVVFASKAVENHFNRRRSDLCTGILYAPVDTAVFDPGATGNARSRIRAELGIPEAAPIVGMVGNINYLKGVTEFVAAAGLLARRQPDVYFMHVGAKLATKQKLAQHVEQSLTELGLRGKFHLMGKRSNIQDFLSAMDIYVIPSLSEACPISLLEAMSMAKPIVATRVGGIPELVRDGQEGLLVPPESPVAIAKEVTAFLANPEWARAMGFKARNRAVSHFDLTKCVDMHEAYYRRLLGG
jgi:glycosyltransferase involved in cell wall biosynthesis